MKTRVFLPCLALTGLLLGACQSTRLRAVLRSAPYVDAPPAKPGSPPLSAERRTV